MQDELLLTPSKKKNLLMFLGSLAFVAGGFFMLTQELDSSETWVPYLCIGFFGLGALVFMAQLLPGASYLAIRKDGFEFKSLWRGTRLLWKDVEEFGVAELTFYHNGIPRKHRMVGLRFSPSYQPGSRGTLRQLNASLVGFEAALPDSYGLGHEELARLMNERKRAFEGRG